jgi:hypothetical protein
MDVKLMMPTEVAEVYEPSSTGAVEQHHATSATTSHVTSAAVSVVRQHAQRLRFYDR